MVLHGWEAVLFYVLAIMALFMGVFVVTAALSALVLAYYFAPTPPELVTEHASPVEDSRRIAIGVGSVGFRIPANYVLFASDRKGGKRTNVRMAAFLPDLRGYSASESQALAANPPDSEVIYLSLREERFNISEKDRIERIYMPQVVSREGKTGPFGLKQYAFKPSTGYRDDDLLVGNGDAGPVALRCTRPSRLAPSPNCLRETLLGPGVTLTYRFKRSHLENWKDIDKSVHELIGSFARQSQRDR